MPIDLPASSQINARGNQNPLTQATNQRQDAMQAALRALNIKVGETATAVVRQVNSVDEQLRIRLLTLANPATSATETATARPGGASLPSAPLNSDQLMSLLNSRSLKLVELELKGQTVLTFTDQPLKTGAQVPVELQKNGLVLLNSTPKTISPPPVQNPPGPAQGPVPASQGYGQAGSGQPLSDSASAPQAPMSPKPQTPNTLDSFQMSTLQQALRDSLPKQDANRVAITETLTAAHQLSQLIKQPNGGPLRQQLPATVQESLHILASHLRSAEQLSQPAALKNALLNGGLQLEQRLSHKPPLGNPQGGESRAGQEHGNRAELGKVLARQDLKAALLYVLTQIPSSASGALPPTNPSPESLLALLQPFINKSSRHSRGAANVPKEQWLQTIQQQVNQALGKLVLQQLQSLQRSHSTAEGVNTQHWQVEIPIRYGHEVQQLALRIDEEWVQEHSPSGSEAAARVRQWLIKLAFELPQAGAFHAHLTIIDDCVSASLWAEHPNTLDKTQQRLGQLQQRLQQDGIEVKKIECFPGKPVEEKIALNYSLVDIKT